MQMTGGARAAYVLRNTLGELGMVSAPSIFSIAAVHTAFDESSKQLKDAEANTRFTNFLNELDWFTSAVKAQRKLGLPEVKEHKPPAATQPSATIK
jgi:NAD(P)H-dependent FMN reductase